MSFEVLAIPAVILIAVTSLALLIVQEWRWSLLAIAFQYAGVFILVAQSWPVQMAAAKLVAGWMACTILGLALIGVLAEQGEGQRQEATTVSRFPFSQLLFRIFVAALVGMVILSLIPRAGEWLPRVENVQFLGAFLLLGFGLLRLGLTSDTFHVFLGLLTALSGFEILYAAVELSALVAGLLAGVNLGMAMVGAYLISVSTIEEAE